MTIFSATPVSAAEEMPRWLQGPGEVRGLMAECDWNATALGHPATWPESLRSVVRIMLTSRFAMWLAWGEALTFLCNDAYLPTVGLRRDWVIGSRSEKVWTEVWPEIGPRVAHVIASGESTWDEALPLYLERSGFSEETWHTFSYSPVADDAGVTQGMLCVVAEVTEKVIGERQLSILRDIGGALATASTRAGVVTRLENCLNAGAADVPFALIYLADRAGQLGLAASYDAQGYLNADLDDPAIWKLPQTRSDTPVLVDLERDPAIGGPRQALVSAISGAEGAIT